MFSCRFPESLGGIRLMSTHIIWYIISLAFTSWEHSGRSNCHNSCRCPSTTATIQCFDSRGPGVVWRHFWLCRVIKTAQKNHQKQTASSRRPQANSPGPLKQPQSFFPWSQSMWSGGSQVKTPWKDSVQTDKEGLKWEYLPTGVVSLWCYLAVRASWQEVRTGTIRVCAVINYSSAVIKTERRRKKQFTNWNGLQWERLNMCTWQELGGVWIFIGD